MYVLVMFVYRFSILFLTTRSAVVVQVAVVHCAPHLHMLFVVHVHSDTYETNCPWLAQVCLMVEWLLLFIGILFMKNMAKSTY